MFLPLLHNLDPAGVLSSQVDLYGRAHEPRRPFRDHSLLPRPHHRWTTGTQLHALSCLFSNIFSWFLFIYHQISRWNVKRLTITPSFCNDVQIPLDKLPADSRRKLYIPVRGKEYHFVFNCSKAECLFLLPFKTKSLLSSFRHLHLKRIETLT